MKKIIQEITNFFNGQYFADGVRITIGCIVPIFVCAALGDFRTGTLISLGALLVGLSDTPGAPAHRRFGMFACLGITVFTYIVTYLSAGSLILTTIVIASLCFLYAMLAVFNSRAANIGSMGILMLLIHIDVSESFTDFAFHLLYFIIGALWYIIISLSLTQVRPYRLAQQELSETIRKVADYIRIKANFYDVKIDNDSNYLKLIEQQILVHEHQENVRDHLFQSKRSIKDTTKTGRYLTLVFSDIVDLFEQSMATHYDYNAVSEKFGHTGILNEFKFTILKVTNELDHLAYQLNANKIPKPLYNFRTDVDHLMESIDKIEKEYQYNTIALKKVVINIKNIVSHLERIYSFGYAIPKEITNSDIEDADKFVNKVNLDFRQFEENLTLKSTIFRHALRMSIVMTFGYVLTHMLGFGQFNSYWVMLTIMVILKPGFGLTKERNVQRLIGTVVGGIIGTIILITIKDDTTRFVLLVFFFLTAYSLFRVNYIIAVMFMTPYVLIMLSFNGMNTMEMAQNRIIDTFLGGMLAFVSSYVIFPNWESTQVRGNMRKLIIANYNYISQIISIISGQKPTITEYKLARKQVYIATANMGSTFQRMLTEPKRKQKNTKEVNRFVIFNHILSSYSATLTRRVWEADASELNNEHLKLVKKALSSLENVIVMLTDETDTDTFYPVKYNVPKEEEEGVVSEESKLITEQLQFLNKICSDLQKSVIHIIDVEEKAKLDLQQEAVKNG
ncbi:Inner membrane protein yccS [Sphingobacterium spiritivorum]|uniref:Inner membrane protein yccS n=1 Tax=Sphingobacterium spiritivorum TaxID=258 RepID=A0A380BR48_SPHSI|nr:FUSC family membrane protein [Sphingobacterium spiritivorum]SUJ04575.1 Inner membrane protein yccS [Sphingobacterium spiritivorum]